MRLTLWYVSTLRYYEPTNSYDNDAVDDPMVFNYPKSSKGQSKGEGDKCDQKTGGDCAYCVNKQDSWCKDNDWDGQCKSMCLEQHCKPVCSESSRKHVNMHVGGPEVLPKWDTTEVTPVSMMSPHELGADRSYAYAPDEFERHLALAPAVKGAIKCVMGSHVAAIKKNGGASLFLETARFHHAGTLHGSVMRDYAQTLGRMRTEARDAHTDAETGLMEISEEQLEAMAYDKAVKKECKAMAGGGEKEYSAEFKCEVDQPRFWIKWLGRKAFKEIWANEKLKKAMFQDPCCAHLGKKVLGVTPLGMVASVTAGDDN